MIVSLSGLIGSGKDSITEYLVGQCGFTKMSFAGTLKDAVAAIFGWDREMLEGKTPEARVWRDQVDEWWANRLSIPHLTPRWVLQYFGTETCRQHFHNDIWLASVENQFRKMGDKNIVISDSRFINELEMLRRSGALMVVVERGAKPNWWETAKKVHTDSEAMLYMLNTGIHQSEWDWAGYSFDQTVSNNESLSALHYKAQDLVRNQASTLKVSMADCYA